MQLNERIGPRGLPPGGSPPLEGPLDVKGALAPAPGPKRALGRPGARIQPQWGPWASGEGVRYVHGPRSFSAAFQLSPRRAAQKILQKIRVNFSSAASACAAVLVIEFNCQLSCNTRGHMTDFTQFDPGLPCVPPTNQAARHAATAAAKSAPSSWDYVVPSMPYLTAFGSYWSSNKHLPRKKFRLCAIPGRVVLRPNSPSSRICRSRHREQACI